MKKDEKKRERERERERGLNVELYYNVEEIKGASMRV